MESLSTFEAVVNALKQVAVEADVNNGTYGKTYQCHYWDRDTVYDKDRATLQRERVRAILDKKLDVEKKRVLVKEIEEKMKALKEPESILIFKLITPIGHLKGTKPVKVGEKTYKLRMENVQFIHIHENTIKSDIVHFERTDEKINDNNGEETVVINLQLTKTMLDVREPKYRGNLMMVDKTAWVSEISYASMQVVGTMDRIISNKIRGYDVE